MKTSEAVMYMIISPRDVALMDTLRNYKKVCIYDFISNSSMTWKEAKKYGWKCKKVITKIEVV